MSTLFTKQHYVVDVVAGMLAAWIAYRLWLRPLPRGAVPEADRLRAPSRAWAVVVVYGVVLCGAWVIYRSGV